MSTQQQIERLSGWGAFAAIVMFSVGFFRLISGISYLADSRKVNDLTLGLFGDSVWAWGIWVSASGSRPSSPRTRSS